MGPDLAPKRVIAKPWHRAWTTGRSRGGRHAVTLVGGTFVKSLVAQFWLLLLVGGVVAALLIWRAVRSGRRRVSERRLVDTDRLLSGRTSARGGSPAAAVTAPATATAVTATAAP